MAGEHTIRALSEGLAFLGQATTPADRVLMAIAWLGVLALAGQLWTAEPGDTAVVIVDGAQVRRLDLHENRTVAIDGALGTAELAIRDGAVRFRDSPCSAKRCIHAGWQSQKGASAACAPNRVLVQVTGESEEPWDAVSY